MVAGRLQRAVLSGAVVSALVAVATSPLVEPALAESGQATVGDAAEAWYVLPPADPCTSPLGCLPSEPPVAAAYPADTLQVAATAGRETARAFVVPALSELPAAAQPRTGTLVLPVDPSPESGAVSPEAATLLACLTTAPVTDGIAGSSQPPPTSDCATSVPVRYTGGDARTLTVDLEPFLARWAAGSPRYGIAVQAVKDLPADATFAVTLNGRKRAGVRHPRALVAYDVPAPPRPSPPTPTSESAGVGTLPDVTPGTQPSTLGAALPVVAPTIGPTELPAAAAAPATAVSAYQGYRYPVALLLPLVLLGALLFLVRTFTSPATPLSFGRG